MKKLPIIIGILMLLFVVSVSAYQTMVSIQVTSMSCQYCSGTLTQINGQAGSRTTCISTSSACSCISGSENTFGDYIKSGDTYYSKAADVTIGIAYYGCLKLQEKDWGAGNGYSMVTLETCSGATNSRWAFTFNSGVICGGYTYKHIGSTASQDWLTFGYAFIA